MQIKRTTSDDADFKHLAQLLDQELYKRYPDVQPDYDHYNEYEEAIDALLIYIEDQPVACGALKTLASQKDWVEIKRIYVNPNYRGKGLGKQLILALEAWIMTSNCKSIVLETGVRMPEAMQLYQKMGYQIVPNFPPYIGLPHSICMRKLIKA
ncbi:MAG: GNAT family N-acetyltransferase [Saprospiraceae bacterium]|nr:GNAT family N-acetyltransferase [Saprospiraceae bacterium]